MSNRGINWARRQRLEGPTGLKAVLLVHADHSNTHGASWPSKETVAAATGLSKQTVENYERGLVKQGKLIAVPWMLDNRTEGRKGFFLGCARRKDGSLPDALDAFRGRMEFERKNGGPCGRPLDENPSWWSGDKTPRKGHKCTSCGDTCHGSDQVDDTVWYPGEGTTEIPMPDWVREAVEAESAKRTAADSTLPPGTARGTGGRVPPVVPLNPKEEPEPPFGVDGFAANPDAADAASSDDADASSGVAAAPHGDTESAERDHRNGPAAAARRTLPRVTHFKPAAGTSDDEARTTMYRKVIAMPDAAAFDKLAQLRAYRRRDSKTYEVRAREQLLREKRVPTHAEIAKMTIMHAILDFSGEWPMFVDPDAPVDVDALIAYEQTLNELRMAA